MFMFPLKNLARKGLNGPLILQLAAVGTDAAEYLRKMVVQAKIDDDTGNFSE